MTSENFKKWNIILGWIVFAIALITYSLTLEPTVSAWDCGEYISTSVKLEVGHPPGAPLFQMLGAFFAMFTSNVNEIAKMVNFMSALASAFTILCMFWTLTNLTKKLALKRGNISEGKYIAILGSSIVGSLAYTFSDSFWFSAVEGEVYAMSSFLMALLFWLGLKWESEIHTPRGHKWLILISFVVGLSFGVHILSLLVIPAIVLLYFFKTYKNINAKTTAVATVVSVVVLMFVFKFLFPFTLKFFSVSELFFINSIGMPYNSGSIIAAIILIALFYVGLNFTRKKNKVLMNTLILSVLFIMIGFSSWMMLPIRANANTTINENDPSSARELLAYYEREQYGDANVFYDTYYSNSYKRQQDEKRPYKDDKPKYEKRNGKYEIVNTYPHDIKSYTQGLEFYNGKLYESTGQYGESKLRELDYKSGDILKNVDLNNSYFGEGLSVLNNKIYQLTWKEGRGLVYEVNNLKQIETFKYGQSKEGWGLCNDGKRFYKSDGTEYLWLLNPNTLYEESYIQAYTNKGKLTNLNELEWVEGFIYANRYQKNGVAIINPKNGAIEAVIDFKALKSKVTKHDGLDVLNGMAYNQTTKTLFVTGKRWDKLFEVRILKN